MPRSSSSKRSRSCPRSFLAETFAGLPTPRETNSGTRQTAGKNLPATSTQEQRPPLPSHGRLDRRSQRNTRRGFQRTVARRRRHYRCAKGGALRNVCLHVGECRGARLLI